MTHHPFPTAALALALTAAMPLPAADDGIVPTGAGSYTVDRPATLEPLPGERWVHGDAGRPTPTNRWWSSIVWQAHSEAMFPHPLALRCDANGLALTYPGSALVANEAGIIGGGLGEMGDLRIGHSAGGSFPSALLADHSDWFVRVLFKDDEGHALSTSFGPGSPFVYGRVRNGSARIELADKPVVWSGKDTATIGMTLRGRHFGLFGPTGSSWVDQGPTTLVLDSDKDYFSLALLPDDRPETLGRFARCAHRHVTDTRLVPDIDRDTGEVLADYRITTEALEGDEGGTLFALYPHQWKYSEVATIGPGYQTVRGTMKLAEGSGFSTRIPVQGVLPHLPGETVADRAAMRRWLREEPPGPAKEFADTYWEGKRLGKLATLAGVAEAIGEEKLRAGYLAEIRERLENWFTASPGEAAPLFHHDRDWGTLIGSKASYGSDSQINDHHFHYGYFIRAAAELARHQPEWGRRWGPMVNLLVRDIASPRRADPMFPYLRCFDPYPGHSWASGHANFGDGNNQESSSEALNAWYGLILWGEVSGDPIVRDLGLFLFNTERTAIEEYWFDVAETNFPGSFPEEALGMIWGGKGAFSTWFSADIDCIHGINWLPFTPASVYLGRHPGYVERAHRRILGIREHGSNYNGGWGDLVAMFAALHDPAPTASYLRSHPDGSLEGGNTRAFMHHWTDTLARLGQVDASVHSSHPFVNVFQRDGRRTYAAYNPGEQPLRVRFSDGTSMRVPPQSLALHPPLEPARPGAPAAPATGQP